MRRPLRTPFGLLWDAGCHGGRISVFDTTCGIESLPVTGEAS